MVTMRSSPPLFLQGLTIGKRGKHGADQQTNKERRKTDGQTNILKDGQTHILKDGQTHKIEQWLLSSQAESDWQTHLCLQARKTSIC